MINLWNNLPVDLKAVIGTVAFFATVYLIGLAPMWIVNVIFILGIIFAVYTALKLVFSANELKRKWDAEDKERDAK